VRGVALLEAPPLQARAGLVDAALGADPLLSALRDERRAGERALAADRRAGVPDLGLSAGARWDEGAAGGESRRGYELGLSLELPFLDRNQVGVAASRAALAEAEAALAQREAELRAQVEAAWSQVEALGPDPAPSPADALWEGARSRYAAGEASVDELLAAAQDIEAAELAAVDGAEMRRRARLQLSCATGAFPEPEIQALLEESLR
jgi:outer membrane protein TolC